MPIVERLLTKTAELPPPLASHLAAGSTGPLARQLAEAGGGVAAVSGWVASTSPPGSPTGGGVNEDDLVVTELEDPGTPPSTLAGGGGAAAVPERTAIAADEDGGDLIVPGWGVLSRQKPARRQHKERRLPRALGQSGGGGGGGGSPATRTGSGDAHSRCALPEAHRASAAATAAQLRDVRRSRGQLRAEAVAGYSSPGKPPVALSRLLEEERRSDTAAGELVRAAEAELAALRQQQRAERRAAKNPGRSSSREEFEKVRAPAPDRIEQTRRPVANPAR